MNRILRYSLILFTLGSLGCLKTRAELAAEESGQVQQQQTATQQRETAGVGTATSKPPPPDSVSDRLEEYDEQMRNLNGRVDTLENQMKDANAGKQGDKDALAKDKAAIDQKFLAYEEALKALQTQVAALTEDVTKLKTAPPPPPPPEVSSKSSFSEGEERFGAKKWKEAIVSYQKYRDGNPKGSKYAEATYKIGVSFQELGMKDEARAFFEEVGAKFPKSSEAKKAATRLKSLK